MVLLQSVLADQSTIRDLQLFVDASWGTLSVSGYAIFWKGSLIKAVSRVPSVYFPFSLWSWTDSHITRCPRNLRHPRRAIGLGRRKWQGLVTSYRGGQRCPFTKLFQADHGHHQVPRRCATGRRQWGGATLLCHLQHQILQFHEHRMAGWWCFRLQHSCRTTQTDLYESRVKWPL